MVDLGRSRRSDALGNTVETQAGIAMWTLSLEVEDIYDLKDIAIKEVRAALMSSTKI